MIDHTHKQTQYIFCEDMGDLHAFLKTPRKWTRYAASVTNVSSYSWDSNTPWEKAMTYLREGWNEGATRLNNRLIGLPAPTTHHAEYRYDVAGHFPDVPRYLAGDPAHMITRGKRQGNPPVVHIVVDGRMNMAVTADECMNFGLAIAAMIDKLEANDRRVELDVVFSNKMVGEKRLTVGWKVKHAQDHLDVASLAFSLGHPASFRRIGFALMERSHPQLEISTYGFGGPIQQHELVHINANPDALLIAGINNANGACRSEASALQFARNSINVAAGEELISVE